MPAQAPPRALAAAAPLQLLAARLRQRRKALRIGTPSAAQAASMSRTTWQRIERGEPSVTLGAYLNALDALGLTFAVAEAAAAPGVALSAPAPMARLPVARRPVTQQPLALQPMAQPPIALAD